ncbi:hypothetical protein LIER_00413 [Lithospermum erythrorhizon]|uniref:Uncharacterized protein n=1 Tax=Lithospermum erythrorhizon TaxID=34254 RepID=A0AAV3NI22_LITER
MMVTQVTTLAILLMLTLILLDQPIHPLLLRMPRPSQPFLLLPPTPPTPNHHTCHFSTANILALILRTYNQASNSHAIHNHPLINRPPTPIFPDSKEEMEEDLEEDPTEPEDSPNPLLKVIALHLLKLLERMSAPRISRMNLVRFNLSDTLQWMLTILCWMMAPIQSSSPGFGWGYQRKVL